MAPYETTLPRRTRWQIALAHGHYQPSADRSLFPRPSWLITDADIAATGADYVALGHWDRAAKVGNGGIPAFYSGSPQYAGTVNVVRLTSAGAGLERPATGPACSASTTSCSTFFTRTGVARRSRPSFPTAPRSAFQPAFSAPSRFFPRALRSASSAARTPVAANCSGTCPPLRR